jgi:hypothetical protein
MTSPSPLQIRTLDQWVKHSHRFTISADAWKEDSKRKLVEVTPIVERLKELLVLFDSDMHDSNIIYDADIMTRELIAELENKQ